MSPNRTTYSSYIKDMPFLFLETRKAAKTVTDGADIDSIISLSISDNIFQLDKERRRLKLAQRVALRISEFADWRASLWLSRKTHPA